MYIVNFEDIHGWTKDLSLLKLKAESHLATELGNIQFLVIYSLLEIIVE